jgi:phosphate transport system substrate-binding protein
MTAATWILMHKTAQDATASREALKFFAWADRNGGKLAAELDYVAMPANVVKDVQATWAAEMRDTSGKPLFAGTN